MTTVKRLKLSFVICSMLLVSQFATAQYEKGKFYGSAKIAANFCQIDGDGASGYNKIGMELGYMVGQGFGPAKNKGKGGWSYVTGASFVIRGSRRPFDPLNPGMQSFHFIYQMIDIPFFLVRHIDKFGIGAGIRTSYLLKAEDKEQFVLNLQQDMRKVNVLGALFVDYPINRSVRVVLEGQYSVNSIRNTVLNSNVIFRTGVYHNVISLGFKVGLGK